MMYIGYMRWHVGHHCGGGGGGGGAVYIRTVYSSACIQCSLCTLTYVVYSQGISKPCNSVKVCVPCQCSLRGVCLPHNAGQL